MLTTFRSRCASHVVLPRSSPDLSQPLSEAFKPNQNVELFAVMHPFVSALASRRGTCRFGFCAAYQPLDATQSPRGMATFLSHLYALASDRMKLAASVLPTLFHLTQFPPAVIALLNAKRGDACFTSGDKQALAASFHAISALLLSRRLVSDRSRLFEHSAAVFAYLSTRRYHSPGAADSSALRVCAQEAPVTCPLTSMRLSDPVFVVPRPGLHATLGQWATSVDNDADDPAAGSHIVALGGPAKIYSRTSVEVRGTVP